MQVTKAFKNWIPNAFLLGWRTDFEKGEESQPWESCPEECMRFPRSVQTLLRGLRKRKRFKWGTADLKCSQLQHKELKWHPWTAPLPSLPSALWLHNPEAAVFFLFIAHFSSVVCTWLTYRSNRGLLWKSNDENKSDEGEKHRAVAQSPKCAPTRISNHSPMEHPHATPPLAPADIPICASKPLGSCQRCCLVTWS